MVSQIQYRLLGATVARLTPDQTVGGSSPSGVSKFLFPAGIFACKLHRNAQQASGVSKFLFSSNFIETLSSLMNNLQINPRNFTVSLVCFAKLTKARYQLKHPEGKAPLEQTSSALR